MPEAACRVVAVVPVYNHGAAIGQVVAGIVAQGLPCVLVDDGSDAACAQVLDGLVDSLGDGLAHNVQLVRLPHNQGKGGAVIAGLREAQRLGYTHALQIDADGQHDTQCIAQFVQQAQAHVDAVICGCPVFDASVPKSRLYGRMLTQLWVCINTLSGAIADAMCGFRVYPLISTLALLDSTRVGLRMDFDIDILVRLVWRGVRVVNLPTPVRYPLDGVSHFDLLRDNIAISKLHARLFFGMLWRAPWLLSRRLFRAVAP